ncbi:MAG TPA: class I SAM-dependent methyltransferase [Kofleriaceae bacterium]|nr:class I SAM-dependent methyltransferase [Kofleriaceae bacterium]
MHTDRPPTAPTAERDDDADAGRGEGGPRLDNRTYYDDFAGWYERERGRGYHQMLDDLEVGLVERYGRGADVLEAGCGTGLLLERIAGFAARARGIDLSGGMLARAHARGLEVVQGSITALPYADESFDLVCSFKVLAHIADIRGAMSEMSRVTRPGGFVLAEFYNPLSLRYLVKRLKRPSAISDQHDDEAVYTRYDTPARIRSYLPPELVWETARGVRIATPAASLHRVPGLGRVLARTEAVLADAPLVRNLGGFLIAVARKRPG